MAVLAQRPELGSAQGFGKRIGDGTTEAISRLTEIGVGQSLETTLLRIERALSKLHEGTYGTCDACGQPIAAKRLRAMPDSVMCIADDSEGRIYVGTSRGVDLIDPPTGRSVLQGVVDQILQDFS